MSLAKYIERLQRMDSLISMKATGNPDEFARKMSLKRSSLFQCLQEMKDMGVDIRYSYIRQSYFYADGNRITVILEKTNDKKKNDAKGIK